MKKIFLKMKSSLGLTLIELLAVIVILSIIVVITTTVLINVVDGAKKSAFESSASEIVSAASNSYMLHEIDNKKEGLIYEYKNNELINEQTLNFKGKKPEAGIVLVLKDRKVGMAIHNGKWCAVKSYDSDKIVLTKYIDDESCKLPSIDVSFASRPILIEGMTPVLYENNTWVATTANNPYWFNYEEKHWANAVTEDGSFWVWIPRYAYSIKSRYHSIVTGTIDVKFLKDNTNELEDGTLVSKVPTYSGSVQTNYVQHPAFTFGTEELHGFWVAKFQPSGSASNISILPNKEALINMTINDQFTTSIQMKNNSKYGWDPSNVDTHMMKNTEWGAVVYLAKTRYGASLPIWSNNSAQFKTGCAGSSPYATETNGCENEYYTTNGKKASTTHNIYGIYDMLGGLWERTAAYVNNGNSALTTYGLSLYQANSKYKDVYPIGASDTGSNNYGVSNNIFGDSIYEVSETSWVYEITAGSWEGDYSVMPTTYMPFFIRGGNVLLDKAKGVYRFGKSGGKGSTEPLFVPTFRPVVLAQ